jgi:dihydroneopterin aldolase
VFEAVSWPENEAFCQSLTPSLSIRLSAPGSKWQCGRAVPARDVLRIRGLETECVVGVYPRERNRPQLLRIDLELSVDTESAGKTGRLSRTVDYDSTALGVVFLLQSCRFGLLETAAHALATHLLAPPSPAERRAAIAAVRIELIKPQALPGNAVASLCVEREASFANIRHESTDFGSVDVIHESPEAAIVRINFAPKTEAALSGHDAEFVLSSGLTARGEPLGANTSRRLRRDAERRVVNPTRRWQSLIAVRSDPALR